MLRKLLLIGILAMALLWGGLCLFKHKQEAAAEKIQSLPASTRSAFGAKTGAGNVKDNSISQDSVKTDTTLNGAARGGSPSAARQPAAEHYNESVPEQDALQSELQISSIWNTTNPPRELSPKEYEVLKRFGALRHRGKWVPVIDGGSNLVYITTGPLPTGELHAGYEIVFEAAGGLPPYHWAVLGNTLPRDFKLEEKSGRLLGSFRELLKTNFFIAVTDSQGYQDVAEYELSCRPENAVTIVTRELPAACPGKKFLFCLEAEGGTPPYIWSVAGDVESVGQFFIDPRSGEINATILPNVPDCDLVLLVTVGDSQDSDSRELILPIRSALTIADLPETSIYVAEPLDFQFKATGGTAPYVWNLSGPVLVDLIFSTDGHWTGTVAQPGQYEFSVQVSDQDGQSATRVFQLEVLPAAVAVDKFEALLSRTRVALSWRLPVTLANANVQIVRGAGTPPLTPADGVLIYRGGETSCLDQNLAAGTYCYAAFLEQNGAILTSVTPAILRATLPPDANPFAAQVLDASPLHPNAFGMRSMPGVVLGPPRGAGLKAGSTDIFSLGAAVNDNAGLSAPYGGSIILEFGVPRVWNGPGPDFTIFENVFYVSDSSGKLDPESRFMEPALVAVSQDGIHWHQFPAEFSPRYDPQTGQLNLRHPYCYHSGFAGVNPVLSNGYDPDPTDPEVSGGDSFDLAELGLDWIRYVQIQGTGCHWLTDKHGQLIYHNQEAGAASRNSPSSGFDLDAMAGIWLEKVVAQESN